MVLAESSSLEKLKLLCSYLSGSLCALRGKVAHHLSPRCNEGYMRLAASWTGTVSVIEIVPVEEPSGLRGSARFSALVLGTPEVRRGAKRFFGSRDLTGCGGSLVYWHLSLSLNTSQALSSALQAAGSQAISLRPTVSMIFSDRGATCVTNPPPDLASCFCATTRVFTSTWASPAIASTTQPLLLCSCRTLCLAPYVCPESLDRASKAEVEIRESEYPSPEFFQNGSLETSKPEDVVCSVGRDRKIPEAEPPPPSFSSS